MPSPEYLPTGVANPVARCGESAPTTDRPFGAGPPPATRNGLNWAAAVWHARVRATATAVSRATVALGSNGRGMSELPVRGRSTRPSPPRGRTGGKGWLDGLFLHQG